MLVDAPSKRGGNESSPDGRPSGPASDPGYYLISHGRLDFERELGFHVRGAAGLLRLYVRAAVPGYLGTIAALTAIILALPLTHAHAFGVRTPYLVLLGLLASVPASDLAIALINRVVTDLLGPRTLPRLELRDGVPERTADDCRRPDSSYFGSRDQGTCRAPRNPLPRQSRRRSAVRAADRLGGRPDRIPAAG